MSHQHHHLVAQILHLIAGGALGLAIAALAHQFGARSADRLPGESRYPHCFYCFKALSWQDISPLFGWILRPDTLALSCPCGQRKGLWSQPAVEIIGLILGVIAMQLVGWGPAALPLCVGMGLLAAVAFIDLQFGIIPDELNALLAVFGFWWTLSSGGDIWLALVVAGSLLAVGLFCAIGYSRLRKRDMLGLGDVKFFAAAGLWLQPEIAPWFLILGGFIGGITGLIQGKLTGNKEFPFAPALCLSLAVCVFYQITRMP